MEALVFVGVQGAGKSTFYKEYFFRTHLRISLDMLNKSRWREDILVHAAIEAKQPFVVDNTNPTAEVRKKYIDLVRQAHFKCIAYYFDVSFDDALARNDQRGGKEKIPERGLKSTLKIMQRPQYDEGFDEIYIVRVAEKNFSIEQVNQ